MKLGARIFKTGLAIILALYLAEWVGLEPPTFAAIAAAFAIQPSIYRTFKTLLDQSQANVIGAVLGVLFVITFGNEPFVVGVVVALSIAIILKLNLQAATIPISIVTIIIIMETPSDNFLQFAAGRFFLIILGILAAFIVNLIFIPPRYELKLYDRMTKAVNETIQWLMLFVHRDADLKMLKQDIDRLYSEMEKLDTLFDLFKEERTYFLKRSFGKARRVVVFRQMVHTSKKALDVLSSFDKRLNEIDEMPPRVREIIQSQLEHLTTYHNRIMMRYAGKVNSNPSDELVSDIDKGQAKLTNLFVTLYEEPEFDLAQWHHFLPAISEVIEYHEELEYLDQLVENITSHNEST